MGEDSNRNVYLQQLWSRNGVAWKPAGAKITMVSRVLAISQVNVLCVPGPSVLGRNLPSFYFKLLRLKFIGSTFHKHVTVNQSF